MDNRTGKINSVAVLTNPKLKEVTYIPATDIILETNEEGKTYTLGNLLVDVRTLTTNYNKLLNILMCKED
jgi:hypothetical protein